VERSTQTPGLPNGLASAKPALRRWSEGIIEESKYNFAEHFNRGWLEYRKS